MYVFQFEKQSNNDYKMQGTKSAERNEKKTKKNPQTTYTIKQPTNQQINGQINDRNKTPLNHPKSNKQKIRINAKKRTE